MYIYIYMVHINIWKYISPHHLHPPGLPGSTAKNRLVDARLGPEDLQRLLAALHQPLGARDHLLQALGLAHLAQAQKKAGKSAGEMAMLVFFMDF